MWRVRQALGRVTFAHLVRGENRSIHNDAVVVLTALSQRKHSLLHLRNRLEPVLGDLEWVRHDRQRPATPSGRLDRPYRKRKSWDRWHRRTPAALRVAN